MEWDVDAGSDETNSVSTEKESTYLKEKIYCAYNFRDHH